MKRWCPLGRSSIFVRGTVGQSLASASRFMVRQDLTGTRSSQRISSRGAAAFTDEVQGEVKRAQAGGQARARMALLKFHLRA